MIGNRPQLLAALECLLAHLRKIHEAVPSALARQGVHRAQQRIQVGSFYELS